MIPDIDSINSIFWQLGNILTIYVAIALLVFVLGYYLIFDPSATTAGKFIFRFMLSLVGLVVLIFVDLFVDPTTDKPWLQIPDDIDDWHPLFRMLIIGYVAFTITSLAILLALRKWKPESIKVSPDLDLVKPRHEHDS